MKQNYLMENVINLGYDAGQFSEFMEYKMGKHLITFLVIKVSLVISSEHSLTQLLTILLLICRGWHERGQLGV